MEKISVAEIAQIMIKTCEDILTDKLTYDEAITKQNNIFLDLYNQGRMDMDRIKQLVKNTNLCDSCSKSFNNPFDQTFCTDKHVKSELKAIRKQCKYYDKKGKS